MLGGRHAIAPSTTSRKRSDIFGYITKIIIDYVTKIVYRFAFLAREGRLRRRSCRRSEEWRPTLRREPQRREVRTPTARSLRLGAGSRCGSGSTAGSRLRGSASENRHGGAPREVPVAPGQGVARRRRDRVKECACRRSIHPSIGGDAGGSEPGQRKI